MAHKHTVHDTDPQFSINPKTRSILNLFGDSLTLMQYDHNSDRITFILPRYIDGHDMTKCNLVQVHYDNIGEDNEKTSGIYKVTDIRVSPSSEDTALFSWLVSRNATSRVGTLRFNVRFTCTTGDTVEYNWNTDTFDDIVIKTTIDNPYTGIEEHYSDIYAGLLSETKAYVDEALSGDGWLASIKGDKGDPGEDYILTDADKREIAAIADYDAFATETQSGADILHTDIGADDIPVKSLAVTVSSGAVPATLTVKRMGKNLYNMASVSLIYGKSINLQTGEITTSSSQCTSEDYIPVLPNTQYTFNLKFATGGGYSVGFRFYAADKSYLSGVGSPYDSAGTFTTPENCYWVRFNLPQYCHSTYAITTPTEGDIGTWRTQFAPQLEFGSVATDYEAYTETNHSITVTALNTPTELPNITTMLGANTFEVERIEGVTATMDATYRVDPTLAYDKLKAAIVAAGAI